MKLINILGQNFEVVGSTGNATRGGTLLCAPTEKDFDMKFFSTFFSVVTGTMGDMEVAGLWPIKVVEFQDTKFVVMKYDCMKELKEGE